MSDEPLYWFMGSRYHSSTTIPRAIIDDCPHRHRSPETAEKCGRDMDRSIKRGHGQNAYDDRVVMVQYSTGREVWKNVGEYNLEL